MLLFALSLVGSCSLLLQATLVASAEARPTPPATPFYNVSTEHYDWISTMMLTNDPNFFEDVMSWKELYQFEKEAVAELNGYPTVSRWTYSTAEIRSTYSVFTALGKRSGTNRVSAKHQCYAYELLGVPEESHPEPEHDKWWLSPYGGDTTTPKNLL
ncbi:protein E4C [Elephant endotheliotropic herpesvirus 3A]|uniref:Protein E4C n=1 Tax=Elephant endotheliotropic herpesvirus 3A TaxID=1329409 RepID=A0A866VRI4_9BETA|nr:protein E4C [Elephant endotheliotropic herpesvirus 3A]QOE74366.1 protein E4C [Elephant endotheliotropic herpesvirus 3A]